MAERRPGGVRFDVVVAGGGSAGVAAAVTAAEEGASTLLVEASGSVGGTLAWQLLEHSAGFHDTSGTQVVAGFGQRLVDRLTEAGASPGHVRDDVGYTATRTPVDHAGLALVQSMMLAEAGVTVWLHASVAEATVDDTGTVTALAVETASGRREVRAHTVVDATGDAIVAQRAGVRMQGDVAARQPVSLLFKLGGVEFTPLLDYLHAHPEERRPGSVLGDAASDHLNLWGLGGLLAEGHARGVLSLLRTEMHVAGWPGRGAAVVNVTRTNMDDEGCLGAAHAVLSRQVLEFVAWFRASVPGFGRCHLVAVADRVGVRESRRVLGRHTVTRDDVFGGRRFPDVIGRGAFPIDIHAPDRPGLSHTDPVGSGYDVPYGCLVAARRRNLLVAGRCLSSTHEANGSLRITATCFMTGEAAGAAAALAARCGVDADTVELPVLQALLRRRGAILD
jgi:hypothetical protein